MTGDDSRPIVRVWCLKERPAVDEGTWVLWERFPGDNVDGMEVHSLPTLVMRNQELIRNRLLDAFADPQTVSDNEPVGCEDSKLSPPLNYWWMTLPSHFPLLEKSQIYDLARTVALTDLLVDLKPSMIELISPPKGLRDCLQGWAEDHSITLFISSRHSPAWSRRVAVGERLIDWRSLSPGLLLAAGYLVKKITRRYLSVSPERVNVRRPLEVDKLFVGYSTRREKTADGSPLPTDYWGPLGVELEAKDAKHAYISVDPPPRSRGNPIAPATAKRVVLSEKIGAPSFEIDGFLNTRTIRVALINYLAIRSTGKRIKQQIEEQSSSYLGFKTHPLIGNLLSTYATGSLAMRNALWLSQFLEIARTIRPRHVYFLMENQAWERALLAAVQDDADTSGFVHSSIRFWDLRYFYRSNHRNCFDTQPRPTRVLVGNENDLALLASGGVPLDALKTVEALRFMEVFSKNSQITEAYQPLHKNLLIVGDYDEQFARDQARAANFLARTLGLVWKVRFRPHPRGVSLESDLSSDVLVAGDRSLGLDIFEATVVLSSHISSARIAVEASGKPYALMYNPRFLIDRFGSDVPGYFFDDENHLFSLVRRLSEESHRLRPDKVTRQIHLDPKLNKWKALLFADTS